jgi:aldose 1-epimerase
MPTLITIVSPDGATEASFIPEANLVCALFGHEGAELVNRTQGISAYVERGATMGIPLLYPWANRLAAWDYDAAGKPVVLERGDPHVPHDPNGLPIHGVLPSLLRWEPASRDVSDSLRARLSWRSPELLALFPFEHELEVTARVTSGELSISMLLRATGPDPVPVSFGYHPYLQLPGGGREGWHVELGAARRLVLDDQLIPTGASEALDERAFTLGERSLDDGYDRFELPAQFRVQSGRGAITVTFEEGYPYAQVYAPPAKDYICFEPMTAPANALRSGTGLTVVAPGEEYRAAFTIVFTPPSPDPG